MDPMFPFNCSVEIISGDTSKRWQLPQQQCWGSQLYAGPLQIIGKCGKVVRHGLREVTKNQAYCHEADSPFALVYVTLVSQLQAVMVLWNISFIRGVPNIR